MEALAFLISFAVSIGVWIYTAKKLAALNVVLRNLIGAAVAIVWLVFMVYAFVSTGVITPQEPEAKITAADVAQADQQEITVSEVVATLPEIFIITKDEYLGSSKRTIEITLDREATEGELTAIANHMYADRKKDTDRTFIGYRLAGENNQGSYWATTHFNPDLKIEVLTW